MNRDEGPSRDRTAGDDFSGRDPRDGVASLRAVVEAIEAMPADASKAARIGPYLALLRDVPRYRAVVVSSEIRAAEIEELVTRLGLAVTADLAEKLRGLLRAGRAENKATVRTSLRIVGDDDPADCPDVRECVDWSEYPEGVAVPVGWSVTASTLHRTRIVDRRVQKEYIGRPILVTRHVVDSDDGSHSVELAWHDRSRWKTARVPRSLALDARGIVRLADQGLPVSSTSARDMVDWLTRLDQSDGIPVEHGTARMGWVGRGRSAFMVGSRCISATPGDSTLFVPTSPGARQLAEAIAPVGTWDGWIEAMVSVRDRPGLWLAVYAACSPPFLRLLDAPNFGVDFAGRSGTGKTTGLAAGVSVFATPRNARGWRAWNASIAGTEGSAGVLCDLPLALNEGQLVAPHDRPRAGALLYGLIEGAKSAKGALGRLGLAVVDDWRTVLLSTSEEGVVNFAPTDGVRARVITIRDMITANAGQSERFLRAIRKHYGHLLPRIVARLVGMPHDLVEDMREDYGRRVDRYAETATSHVGRRAAQYMATLDLVAEYIHTQILVPRPSVDVLGWTWLRILSEAGGADQALRALETTWTWITSCEAMFSIGGGGRVPPGGWLGWALQGSEYIGVVPERLYEVLGKAGYGHPEAILTQWRDRGWTKCDSGRLKHRGRTSPGRMGDREYMIAILRSSRAVFEPAAVSSFVDASTDSTDLDGGSHPL